MKSANIVALPGASSLCNMTDPLAAAEARATQAVGLALPQGSTYARTMSVFQELTAWSGSPEASRLDLFELERQTNEKLRQLGLSLLQDHLDERARCEARLPEVRDAKGRLHGTVAGEQQVTQQTIFGTVTIGRLGYRHWGTENLYPADAILNLPQGRHSHGLQEIAVLETTAGSYIAAQQSVERQTGQHVGERQMGEMVLNAAREFEAFYAQPLSPDGSAAGKPQLVVASLDSKAIPMRYEEDLRGASPAEATTAEGDQTNENGRGATPSSRPRAGQGRMAIVSTVYDAKPVVRTSEQIIAARRTGERAPRPTAVNKWVSASLEQSMAESVRAVLDEVHRRDPGHERTLAIVVDGANHQLDCIEKETKARDLKPIIVCDIIHVIEHIWEAARAFYREVDQLAEMWVEQRIVQILNGEAGAMARGLRRRARDEHLSGDKLKKVEETVTYLTNKLPYLDYPKALAAGLPIASGVIEGAVRHLVNQRMNISGAFWGLAGAEALLKVRAIVINGDWNEYWRFHMERVQERVHRSRYLDNRLPQAA